MLLLLFKSTELTWGKALVACWEVSQSTLLPATCHACPQSADWLTHLQLISSHSAKLNVFQNALYRWKSLKRPLSCTDPASPCIDTFTAKRCRQPLTRTPTASGSWLVAATNDQPAVFTLTFTTTNHKHDHIMFVDRSQIACKVKINTTKVIEKPPVFFSFLFFWLLTIGRFRSDSVRSQRNIITTDGWFMPIVILSDVHVHNRSGLVSNYFHCTCSPSARSVSTHRFFNKQKKHSFKTHN